MLPFKPVPGQFSPEVRQKGLWVWRVEKMKAVPLDSSEVGAFFNGDSYLVLDNRGEEGADLHMWIGKRLKTHLAYATCYPMQIKHKVVLTLLREKQWKSI